jgi:exosome complex RNA-binding protein Rrp4
MSNCGEHYKTFQEQGRIVELLSTRVTRFIRERESGLGNFLESNVQITIVLLVSWVRVWDA